MTEQQKQAAAMVATNKLTVEAIGKEVGVSRKTIYAWKGLEEFDTEVRRLQDDWRAKARGKGVADPDERLRHLNDLHKRCRAVILERAKDPAMQKVPGGRTGLLTVTYKMLSRVEMVGEGKYQKEMRVSEPCPEYQVDVALIAEMRAIKQQAAIERGQWKTRSVHEDRRTVDATPRALALAKVFSGLTGEQLAELEQRIEKLEQGEEEAAA